MVNKVEDCKNLLSRDEEYNGCVELTCISRLFSNYLFRVHFENNTNTIDYGLGDIVCHLLFSGNYNAGHFNALQNKYNFSAIYILVHFSCRQILKGTN